MSLFLSSCVCWFTFVVVLTAVLVPFWLVNWHGAFDSFFVPQQRNFLQEPTLLELLRAAKASGEPCIRSNRVVVTLSTFVGRLGNLRAAVGSLVAQSCPADAIYIFVSRNPQTKSSVGKESGRKGDGVAPTAAFWSDIRSLGNQVVVKEIDDDWGPATKLLAALQVETDPRTWLITVDDDTRYHSDTVLALTLAAAHLPSHTAPAFWCEEAWADGYRSVKKRTMERGEEGTVHGWCGGFAGVLFRRFMFDDQVFNFSAAPSGCRAHDDVWWGGHLLSAGNEPYLISPGFFSVIWSPTASTERQDQSIHVLDAMAKAKGIDLQADCASWFAGLRGIHFDGEQIPAGVFKHREALAQAGQDLWVRSRFFSDSKGALPLDGTFVEFGALDGKYHSNTNFFETHLHWRGALAEPSQHFAHMLGQNRPRSLGLQGAVCGREGLRNFVDTPWPGLSGLEDTYDPALLAKMKAGQLWFNITSITPVQCHTLQELLDKANLQHVNYMTVDTEGSEFETLSTFPFDKYQVDLIQVEVRMRSCLLAREGWSRADPWKYFCIDGVPVERLSKLMASHHYTLEHTFIVDIGGNSRGSMHERWLPLHFTGEMTADMVFQKQLGDPSH
eukprot:gnl/TRDRNA2_/TRDRNA2_69865_c0_seq2.p1 gnl/TRDRNA2_/TRDRNA2_69865_c0~~gnl/TRDRNA2_/TRDRNA2_69865_c0_seq2.p1  ORF type:complete len:614 (-),score=69.06 gnl/TRDRNA2_/TRDRNA2_69865_c0_seq2:52-1893(-)